VDYLFKAEVINLNEDMAVSKTGREGGAEIEQTKVTKRISNVE
jgi:hypothetical protein